MCKELYCGTIPVVLYGLISVCTYYVPFMMAYKVR